jgi:hypothetical protein
VRDVDDLTGDRPLSWRESVWEWRDYIEDTEDTDAVFKNRETGQYHAGSSPHRFDPDYSKKQYAKLKDLERGLREEYGRRLHTAMLSLTASSAPDGEPLPPVDHLEELDSSWEAVRRALARQLDGRRWEYLAILEPHQSGYLHIHIAVFVDGVVTRTDLAPVIRAHLRNCDLAGEDAHRLDDDSTISINRVGVDRKANHALAEGHSYTAEAIGNLGTYLSEYLGAYGDDPLASPDHVQMSNTVLWSTGKQRWRPSQGAQQYMKSFQKEDDDSPWELVGIRSGTDYYPCEDASGGVDRFVTSTDALDPPD